MIRVTPGKSGVGVSLVCYGTDLSGRVHDQEMSFKQFDTFYGHGGTFLDTANFYSSWYEGCVGGEGDRCLDAAQ